MIIKITQEDKNIRTVIEELREIAKSDIDGANRSDAKRVPSDLAMQLYEKAIEAVEAQSDAEAEERENSN